MHMHHRDQANFRQHHTHAVALNQNTHENSISDQRVLPVFGMQATPSQHTHVIILSTNKNRKKYTTYDIEVASFSLLGHTHTNA